MANVGYATLPIIPSLKGVQGALSSGIAGPAGVAGTQAGGLFGGGFGAAVGPALIAGGAVVAVGGLLAKVGADFDEAYDNIRAKTGATGSAFDGLQDSFRSVFGAIPTTMGDASDAVAGLNQRLGITGKPLERLSQQVIQLSDLTETDLNQNIAASSRVFGDWGVGVNQQSGTLDKFLRASQASGAGVSDLMSSVVQFGSPLRNLGFSLDESIALFAGFEKGGVNASTAMSGIRQAVGNFAQDGISPMEGLRDVMGEVEAGTFTMTDAIDVFGKRAAPDMFAALQEGKFDLTTLLDQIQNGSETIGGAAEDTYDWQESLTQLKNKGLLLIEPIANRVFGALASGAKFALRLGRVFDRRGLTGVLTILKNKFDELSPTIKAIAAAIALIVAPVLSIGVAIGAGIFYAYTHFEGFRNVVDSVVRWLVGTAWPAVQRFATGVAEVFSDVVGWVRANWPAIQEAVGHVLAAVKVIITNFTTSVKALWDTFGSSILSAARTIWNFIRSTVENGIKAVQGVIDVVLGLINGDWSRVWDGIKTYLSALWSQIGNIVRLGVRLLRSVLSAALAGVKALWRLAWAAIKTALSAAWQGIQSTIRNGLASARTFMSNAWAAMKTTVRNAWSNIKTLVRTGIDRVVGFVEDLPTRISDFAEGAFDGIVDAFKSAINTIIDAWNGLEFHIPGVDPPGPGSFGGFTVGTPDIPHLAEGGTLTRSGAVLIGENGPEVLDLPNGARVSPLSGAVVSTAPPQARVVIDFTGFSDDLARDIRKRVRVEGGGNVQVAFGTG